MTSVLLGRALVPDFFNPRPEDVDVGFMFWRMRRMRRFSGNRSALTLDIHHELCGLLADELQCSRPARIWARCHDLHEFAIGDIVCPVKADLGSKLVEQTSRRWDEAIAARLGLLLPSATEALEVSLVDDMALAIEWRELLGRDMAELGIVVPDLTENAVELLGRAISAMGAQTWWSETGSTKDETAYNLSAYAGEQRLRRAVTA